MAKGSFVLPPAGILRRCRAYHGQKTHIQCELQSAEYARHAGDHEATDPEDGLRLHWTDLACYYPERARSAQGVFPAAEGANASQVGGDHYRKFQIQPWDIIDEYELSFYAGNALKYLLRAGNKGSRVEDLRKCRHYLDKLIEIEEGK